MTSVEIKIGQVLKNKLLTKNAVCNLYHCARFDVLKAMLPKRHSGISSRVVWQSVPKDCMLLSSRSSCLRRATKMGVIQQQIISNHTKRLLELLDPDVECTTNFRNVHNYAPVDTA